MKYFIKYVLPILVLFTMACTPSAEKKDNMAMRTYTINPLHSVAIKSSLDSLLSSDQHFLGKVKLIDDKQLVVVATESIQKDIERLIEKLNKRSNEDFSENLKSTIYLLSSTKNGTASILAPEEVVKAAQSTYPGIKDLYVVDKVVTRLSAGTSAQLQSAVLSGEIRFSVEENKILATYKVSFHHILGVSTDLRHDTGMYVLIGELREYKTGDKNLHNLFLAVKVDIEN